ARRRVEALDWVGEARVFRLLPTRVQVVVSEQVPLARWQIDGRIVVIDETGQPIEQAGPTDYAQLPLVVGEGAAAPAPALLAALAAFPDVAAHVEAAQRVGERRWTLYLDNGAQLLLPEDGGEAALAIVSRLHAERNLLNAPAELIDLRNPDRMVIRGEPAPEGTGASRAYGPGREA
ncbi:MAG TPA: cell division protein FtsQ/DivIB, partial [Myxococcota bacterium]|nr:cell division protein FtsQ/DivIB [Myxococcota bacterium]